MKIHDKFNGLEGVDFDFLSSSLVIPFNSSNALITHLTPSPTTYNLLTHNSSRVKIAKTK